MHLEYPNHRGWIGFTAALLLLCLGIYLGQDAVWLVGQAPAGASWVLLSAAILLKVIEAIPRHVGRRKDRSWHSRPAGVLFLITGGCGLFLLGSELGRRWASLGGPAASNVIGMGFGILGSLCMVFAGMLSGLRRVSSWWILGSRAWWLKGHIWLGLLSVPLIYFHSAGRLGGPLEQVLWLLLILVVGSGLVGWAIQQVLPGRLTVTVLTEVPYEQISHLCEMLRVKADELFDKTTGQLGTDPAGDELRNTYVNVIVPFLLPVADRSSPLARSGQREVIFDRLRSMPGRDLPDREKLVRQLTDLEAICKDRQQMSEQERLHQWLHFWLFAHVPLSVALLALGAVHAVVSLYY